MSIPAKLRGVANTFLCRFGLKLVRLNSLPEGRRMKMISYHNIGAVVDVGGNVGSYGEELRAAGFHKQIISFEPAANAFNVLSFKAKGDAFWTVRKCAIGETEGEVELNIAGNDGASSSILPMCQRHKEAAPTAAYVGVESVPLMTLDKALEGLLLPDEQVLLKLDIQGYESMALAGAKQTLRQVALIECELSLVQLYEGQMCFDEMLALLKSLGFRPVQFSHAFIDAASGESLQLDGMFSRY